MAVGLGKDQGFGHFLASRENLRQLVAEGADDGAYLVGVDDVAVKLGRGIGLVFVLLLPALLAGELFAALDLLLGANLRTLLGDLGFNHINFIANVHAIGHGFFVAVVADHVFLEEPVGAVVRRSGEADEAGVEIVDYLLPQVAVGTPFSKRTVPQFVGISTFSFCLPTG